MNDLGRVQMMGQMGLANQMMEVLTRITFGLADQDRDGRISRPEAVAFATTHLREGQPLAKTLGLMLIFLYAFGIVACTPLPAPTTRTLAACRA